MKLAYFAQYHNSIKESEVAIDNILAIKSAGINVVCRPINIGLNENLINTTNDEIQQLEQSDLTNTDVIIQHVQPQFFEYKYGVKNIGYIEHITSDFKLSNWADCASNFRYNQ